MENRIKEYLEKRNKKGLLRSLFTVHRCGRSKIIADGKEYTDFSSNDYLGLAAHPALKKKAGEYLDPVVGTSASRLMSGTTALHDLLEKRTALFKHKPAALVFNSGYQANVGVISTLCGKGDVIFSDKLNHASIIDGIKLSGAKLFRFRHNDVEHLEELLKKERKNFKTALVVTETVFSMDGDRAPLKAIVRCKKDHDCMMMVDEAHATGIFGSNGGGITEEEGVSEDVDVIMGTFSKALGGFGAYIAVSELVRDFMINSCRSFIYSTALPVSIIASNIAALDILNTEIHRRKDLLKNVEYFREGLNKKGVTTKGDTQIVPIMVGSSEEAVKLSEDLRRKGLWAMPVRPPTVPQNEARLRVSLTYDHTKEILDYFLNEI